MNSDWIVWHGGDCPVDPTTLVQVQARCETLGFAEQSAPQPASIWQWTHDQNYAGDDIVAYRIVETKAEK